MKSRLILLIVLTLFWGIPNLAQEGNIIIGEAYINRIAIDDSGDAIVIHIEGELGDPCTEIDDITQIVAGDTIIVTVVTARDADLMCAAVLKPFETDYTLDTSDLLASGLYTIVVGDQSADVNITVSFDASSVSNEDEIAAHTCPQADDDQIVFDQYGMCFVYPDSYTQFSGNGFVLISRPLTSDALLIVMVTDAQDSTLATIAESLTEDAIYFDEVTIQGADAIIINTDDSREAYLIANGQRYQFIVEPINDADNEQNMGTSLWNTVMDSLILGAIQADDE